MQSFRDRGTSILLVSHDLETVADYCDRVAWLEHGKLMAVGPTDEVLEPFHEAVMAPHDAI